MPVFNFHKTKSATYYENRLIGFLRSKMRLFVEWFITSPAENYITLDIEDRKAGERYVLTLQRANGKTPSQVMQENQAEIERLKSFLSDIGDLAWDVRDPNQAKVRIGEISGFVSEALD